MLSPPPVAGGLAAGGDAGLGELPEGPEEAVPLKLREGGVAGGVEGLVQQPVHGVLNQDA